MALGLADLLFLVVLGCLAAVIVGMGPVQGGMKSFMVLGRWAHVTDSLGDKANQLPVRRALMVLAALFAIGGYVAIFLARQSVTNGQTGGDFRILVLVLIGLARFGKTPAIGRARKRLRMAIGVLRGQGKDGRLTQEELSLLVLGLHLAVIDNSAKLQELVAKKVQILVSNRHTDPDFKEGLTREKFPRMAVHGAAELVFPSVHEESSGSEPAISCTDGNTSSAAPCTEKRRTRVWSPEEIRAVQEHMKNTQAGAFDETKGLDRTERVPATPKLLESAAVTATFRRVEASMALKEPVRTVRKRSPVSFRMPKASCPPVLLAPEITREDHPPFPRLLTTHRKTRASSSCVS
ncbi:unnamed protein product [Effrenium voratum]|uniref:Uncharacterized protein n=1 Tax=Effrenium voratum TaxID=2562239 RepID=A0AA36MYU3_9DINO|nr:unnamed protein product [Effrenium voratum]